MCCVDVTFCCLSSLPSPPQNRVGILGALLTNISFKTNYWRLKIVYMQFLILGKT